MATIARLNWPFYLVASLVFIVSLAALFSGLEMGLKLLSGIAMAGAAYFLFVSLGVSHLVYDRSDLYRWKWLDRALRGGDMCEVIYCHSGFDDCSAALREKMGTKSWTVLDHYDERRMTEASIRRARQLFPPLPGTVVTPFDRWPVETRPADVVFGMLAIHELRIEEERVAWFREAKRFLKADGRIVIVEHTRDLANFLAFGPGFLHFHSPASWRRCWEQAGLQSIDEFKLTPWLRVFILTVH